MKIIVTGAAGFIGSTLTRKLLARGDDVLGIDNLNDYYDVNLKQARLEFNLKEKNFRFAKIDIAQHNPFQEICKEFKPRRIVHLAAQAGVRYSIQNPYAYVDANLQGFINVLEIARHLQVEHLAYASSSSVYGANTGLPFSIHHNVDHPVSLYAATKKANELMAHSYSHLYQIPTTGLRFFTVYGPWGRPDMALFLFAKNILEGKPIDVFNHGHHRRDFTYIDDIVEGVTRVLDRPAQPNPSWTGHKPDPGTSSAPYRIYNIGNNHPVLLNDFISCLEEALGKKATKNFCPMAPGDVPETYAGIDDLVKDFDFRPKTSIQNGIQKFVDWYRAYYKA